MALTMQTVAERIVGRVTGPMSFRFILQPCVAILLGIRDGRLDAKAGTPPYIFDVLFRPKDRDRALKSALHTLLTPMIVGTVLDAIAQYLIFQNIRVVGAMLVGALVMGVPYSLARGITNRIITATRKKDPDSDSAPVSVAG
jgi:hypothetical protein